MNVPMWNSGPEFRKTYESSMPDHWRHQQSLRDQRTGRQHGGVGPARERGRVDEQQRSVGSEVGVGIVGRPRRDERLVLTVVMRVAVVADPARGVGGLRAPGPDRRSDFLLLPDDDRRCQVVDDEGELVGLLAPVHGTEHRPDLAAREQQLLHAEGVLAEPRDAIAGPDPGVTQGVGAPVHPRRGFGPRQCAGAVGEGDRGGTGADVGAEHVGERAAIGRHRKNLSGALGAPDSCCAIASLQSLRFSSVRGPPGFSLTSCVATQ